MTTIYDRFWEKVDLGDGRGCWLWAASKTSAGHGRFNKGGGDGFGLAHRIVYEWTYGSIESGLRIQHLCPNAACVNPAHLSLLAPAQSRLLPRCTVDECERQVRSRFAGLCDKHYHRLRRTGSTQDRDQYPSECSVEDCAKPSSARGYCGMHYWRLRKHGDTSYVMPHNPNWTGADGSYGAVHQRLNNTRGSARMYKCVDCGQQARQWSYDRRGGTVSALCPHETDLDRYVPRCVPCHKRFDLNALRGSTCEQ